MTPNNKKAMKEIIKLFTPFFTKKEEMKFAENVSVQTSSSAPPAEEKQVVEVITQQENPKEKTPCRVLMSVTCVNNKTDKEYTFVSEDDFGITWTIDIRQTPMIIDIKKKTGIDGEAYFSLAKLQDFSIIKNVFENKELSY